MSQFLTSALIGYLGLITYMTITGGRLGLLVGLTCTAVIAAAVTF